MHSGQRNRTRPADPGVGTVLIAAYAVQRAQLAYHIGSESNFVHRHQVFCVRTDTLRRSPSLLGIARNAN